MFLEYHGIDDGNVFPFWRYFGTILFYYDVEPHMGPSRSHMWIQIPSFNDTMSMVRLFLTSPFTTFYSVFFTFWMYGVVSYLAFVSRSYVSVKHYAGFMYTTPFSYETSVGMFRFLYLLGTVDFGLQSVGGYWK